MKSFAAALIMAAAIIFGSISYTIYLDGAAETLSAFSEQIQNAVLSDNYKRAEAALEKLSASMESKKIALAATIDHNSIDNIERNIAELTAYLSEKQRYDAVAKCEVLKTLFEHLPKNYALKLENIL